MEREQADDLFGAINNFLNGNLEDGPKPPKNDLETRLGIGVVPTIETPPFGPMELEDYAKYGLIRKMVPGIPTVTEAILISHFRTRFQGEKVKYINEIKAKGGNFWEDLFSIADNIQLSDFHEFSVKQKEISISMLADEESMTPGEINKWEYQIRYWGIIEKATKCFVNSDHLNA